MSQTTDDNQIMLSFRLPADAVATIEARAAKAGLSRSEYLRARVLSDPAETPNNHFEALLRYLIYITNRTHIAVYSIAENAGTLTTDRLQTIYDDAVTAGLRYMTELPERMAKTQAQIAAQTNTAPPAAE